MEKIGQSRLTAVLPNKSFETDAAKSAAPLNSNLRRRSEMGGNWMPQFDQEAEIIPNPIYSNLGSPGLKP
jgi:hypothetical protein